MIVRNGALVGRCGRVSRVLDLAAQPPWTAHLDRLGHVRRLPHATDRRSVTDHARDVFAEMSAPFGAHLAPVYAKRTPQELGVIADFLDEVTPPPASHASKSVAPHPLNEGRRPLSGERHLFLASSNVNLRASITAEAVDLLISQREP